MGDAGTRLLFKLHSGTHGLNEELPIEEVMSEPNDTISLAEKNSGTVNYAPFIHIA